MHIHCNFAELRFDKTAITCVVLNMRVCLLKVDFVVVWFSAQLQAIFLITELIDRIGLIGTTFYSDDMNGGNERDANIIWGR